MFVFGKPIRIQIAGSNTSIMICLLYLPYYIASRVYNCFQNHCNSSINLILDIKIRVMNGWIDFNQLLCKTNRAIGNLRVVVNYSNMISLYGLLSVKYFFKCTVHFLKQWPIIIIIWILYALYRYSDICLL